MGFTKFEDSHPEEVLKGFDTEPDSIKHGHLFYLSAQESVFQASRLNVSSRVLSHWRKENLLIIERNKEKNKFTLIEYIWLKLVIILREFGLSFDKIRLVKYQLFWPLFEVKKYESSEELEKEANKHLNYIQKEYDKTNKTILAGSTLFRSIFSVLVLRQDWNITIYTNGVTRINTGDKYIESTYPKISIPLNFVLGEFLKEHKNYEKIKDVINLSEKEKEIFKSIREDNVSKIMIRFEDDSEPIRIEIQKIEQIPDAEKRISELLVNGIYQAIELYAEGKKIRTYKTTIKKKL